MSATLAIRQARLEELPRLTEIELDAFATLAEALGISDAAQALPHDVLRKALEAGLLIVAADSDDRPVGFLAAEEIHDTLYVIELDVSRDWQRKGVGRRLMSHAVEMAKTRRLSALTLTTDRHVPFNAPFYQSIGFQTVGGQDMPPFLWAKIDDEVSNGMDPERRVAMVLTLGGASSHLTTS
ncbi:GNAT family N-acetyltransferase [Rhizobium sp. 2MFCol3.1]|uniref:GNAT family N-acetyltransferase n=1 Tax=Rhizobium sp. 2MFCol3.1 TaxID=1246459 RepID=UPI0003A629E3|nr:GNAT family N-acetyltransferase [Rhizobium sp. 2MFCol3.1]